MSYQITGNKIPVTKEELINYIHQQLTAFDSGNIKDYNPYTDAIIYITKDGKTIQIPTDIHKEAISQWKSPVKAQLSAPVQPIQAVQEEVESGQPDYITIGILILAAIIAFYLFNKSGIMNDQITNPNVKYYLTK